MAGIKALRKLQLGREVTAGTAVAATTLWRGMGTIEDQRKVVFPPEDVGLVVATDRSYVAQLKAELAMEPVEATFEQLPHIFEAGIKLIGTGAADGVGTDKIYDYTLPEASKNTIKTYTIEGGDDQEAEEMEYSFVKDFTLTGAPGEALKMSANWVGRQVSLSTFTGAIAIPTVEEILFSKGKLYVDAVGGVYGTTLKSSTFLGMSLKGKTGWVAKFTADGSLFFTFAKLTRPEITVDITFEHDATGAAGKVDWRAQTARKIQMKWEGSAVATPGTTYTYKTLIVNLAGKWSKFTKLGESDGNDILTGTFVAGYNATAADIGEIIVVNELTVIP